MEERNVTCTPVLARFNRPPAVGDQWSCLGLCATQVRPRSGILLSLAGSRVRASPALAGRLRAPVVRRHRRSGPRPSRASPRSATLGCRESQDPPGYSMVALEGVKRGCQADLSASTGKRKPAVAPGRAPEEQPRWFSWPQSTFHSLVSKDDAWARGRIFPKHGEKNPV